MKKDVCGSLITSAGPGERFRESKAYQNNKKRCSEDADNHPSMSKHEPDQQGRKKKGIRKEEAEEKDEA
jgi:hypothetical protein